LPRGKKKDSRKKTLAPKLPPSPENKKRGFPLRCILFLQKSVRRPHILFFEREMP
jgi:hypothetical protein